MMSFKSPKKAAECFQSFLVASSMARMAAWYPAWFKVMSGVVAVAFEISSPLKYITAPLRGRKGEGRGMGKGRGGKRERGGGRGRGGGRRGLRWVLNSDRIEDSRPAATTSRERV